MFKFKNSIIAFAGLLSLLGVIALITPHTGVGQNNKPTDDVRLVATTVTQPVSASSALPVTGSVGIDGTPNVNVANTPTVQVGNDATNPLPVRDVDNPARAPFTFDDTNDWFSTAPNTTFSFPVPAGKRLVIEQVSVEAKLTPSASQKLRAAVLTITGGVNSSYALSGTDAGQSGFAEVFVASSQMKCYADAGTSVQVFVTRNDTSGGAADHVEVSLSGYLVNVP